jgi:predicted RNase H-like HicB family nuclease
MRRSYTVVLVPDPQDGYVVEVPAVPGVATYGRTLGEALLNAEDAIGGVLAVLREEGEPLPREGQTVTVRTARRSEVLLRRVAVVLPEEAAVAIPA